MEFVTRWVAMQFITFFRNVASHITMSALWWISISNLETVFKRMTRKLAVRTAWAISFLGSRLGEIFARVKNWFGHHCHKVRGFDRRNHQMLSFLLLDHGEHTVKGWERIK
jgi:hypothetical protein